MDYTAYWIATGLIDHDGCNTYPEGVKREGLDILLGVRLSNSKWRLDPETLEPIALIPNFDVAGALYEIDQQAESVRGKFITNTASQPAVYMAKEVEANAFMADPEISEALTPNITMEAARTGESRFDVAVAILTQANTWRQISALIEDRRLGAKDQVRSTGQPVVVDWSDIAAMAPAS